MSTALTTLSAKLAAKLEMGEVDSADLVQTLKATAFNAKVTNEQMTALLVVANQYGLNPWTKEIYAFPGKSGEIVPVVGVDGWARICNDHPQFDGVDFEFSPDGEACTCLLYRKDRSRPVVVTEYMAECRRGTPPWQSHPRRMLRHKALIQAARLAFGFTGVYDPDDAEVIAERDMGAAEVVSSDTPRQDPPSLPEYPEGEFGSNLPKWEAAIKAGRITADAMIARISSKYTLSDAQAARIRGIGAPIDVDPETGEVLGDDPNAAWVNDYEGAMR